MAAIIIFRNSSYAKDATLIVTKHQNITCSGQSDTRRLQK